LALLIFSYLYLWTAALAWLVCISGLWLWLRWNDKSRLLRAFAIIGAMAAIAIIPYGYLVSHRPPTLDEQQTLALTHRPDLLRVPELLGLLLLAFLVIAVRRRRAEASDSRAIFAASLGLLPLVVFNQQILTGRTMQPYHYAAFVVNYTVLIGLVITVRLWGKNISTRALVWIATLSFIWGIAEVGLPARYITVPAAVANDQMVPVLRRLKQLSTEDGSESDLRSKGAASTIVFSPQIMVTSLLPTWTLQGTLPDAGGIDFGRITQQQRKEYFLIHLYYANADLGKLRNALRGDPSDPAMKYYARSALFGHERIKPALAAEFKPIEDEEIENEIKAYQDYAAAFSRAEASKRPLTYVITKVDTNFDFTNIDRWYDRDRGERVGDYVLFRVKLKN
jgi:hypothetical protein